MGEKATNHKAEGVGQIRIRPHDFTSLARIHGYGSLGFNPATEGGIVKKGTQPWYYVRPPFWRGVGVGEDITMADLLSVTTREKDDLRPENVDSGLELEFLGVNRATGEAVSGMMNPGHPFRKAIQPLLDTHAASPEFPSLSLELNFPHDPDIDIRTRGYLDHLQTSVTLAENHGILLAPIALLPDRSLTQADITNEPYFARLGLNTIGWESVRHFDVHSMQTHTEVLNHEAARQTINYKQFIAPLLLALSLSGPAIAGHLTPDFTEVYKDLPIPKKDKLKQQTMDWLLDNTGSTFQSYRSFNRFFGSLSGGIMREPLPVTEEEFFTTAESMLKTGIIPSPARVGGHHTDRYRPDILPYGTIETCVMDPAGGRIQRVHALREFNRILDWKMQMLFINGQFDQKAEEYKALFGKSPSKDSFETAHWNLMKVAKDGTTAVLDGMDGKEYPIQQLWDELVRFVQEPLIDEAHLVNYQGLPASILTELDSAYQDPTQIFAHFEDENGVTSTQGFYKTGIGNLSQWMIKGIQDRMTYQDMTEREAILAMNRDVGENWHAHVKEITYADIPGFVS